MSMILHERARSAPQIAGVYIFWRGKTPIYIGKAGNLKKRLASYFRVNAAPKVRALREEATMLAWQETASEIEALIREAELIKKHLPKYNVLLRDDKSYYYVAITHEQFPRVFVVHKTRLAGKGFRRAVGPFTSGSALFGTLRILRRIFPYCTCKQVHKRPCVNAQIGRCLGFCCDKTRTHDQTREEQGDYQSNIRNIIAVLSGGRKRILSRLKREMRDHAKKHAFEAASQLRDQAEALENVFSHQYTLESNIQKRSKRDWQKIEKEIQKLLRTTKRISRVEGYDISNISGTAASGSMVVFINGLPTKSLYRKFKIKTVHQANDIAMHQEMMRRRLLRKKWDMPDMVVIDGGLPQLNAIRAVLRPGNENILLTALAKREEELYIDPVRSKTPKASADVPSAHRTSNGVEGKVRRVRLNTLSSDVMLFFQHVRDESHRFAKKYHHKLRELAYREEYKIKN
ncbi:MAG: GIY-YIG nuclease family protein [Candidatus Sungiibacteriota bacterium]